MVRKIAENGSFYHEPPYTEEEELDLYCRMAGGPFKVLHASRPPAAAPEHPLPKSPPRSPAE
jgi:hypothetical protein